MNTTIKATSHARGPRVTISRLAAASVIAAVASLTSALAQPRFSITVLPTPAGFDESIPSQINDQGYVAGYSASASGGYWGVATIWKNGVPTVLGRLKDGTYSSASAINSKGVAVGDGDDGDGRPLGWVSSSGKVVNFFSNNGGNTHPISINDAGIIGGYYVKGFSSPWRGAIWTVDAKDPRKSTKFDLPLLPGSDPLKDSYISWSFNKLGQATGYGSSASFGQHAVLWNNDASHSIVDLGVFGYDWSSLAYSINDLGQVVGESHPPFGSRPVLWHNDPAHTAFELPLLPGDNYGSAQLINNEGTIIGSSAYGEPGTWNVTPSRTVIWIDGQVYEFQSLLDASAAGWIVGAPISLNNKGQMTTTGSYNGVNHALILNPIN